MGAVLVMSLQRAAVIPGKLRLSTGGTQTINMFCTVPSHLSVVPKKVQQAQFKQTVSISPMPAAMYRG